MPRSTRPPEPPLPDDPAFNEALQELAFTDWSPRHVRRGTRAPALDLPDCPELDGCVIRLGGYWGIAPERIRREVRTLRREARSCGGWGDLPKGRVEVDPKDPGEWRAMLRGDPHWPLGSHRWCAGGRAEHVLREAVLLLAAWPGQADTIDDAGRIVVGVDHDRAVWLAARLAGLDELDVVQEVRAERERQLRRRWPGLVLPPELRVRFE